ncbi:helix-turn-helix domain containing protein [Roseibacterium sp. SDUM158017]|uniref:TetR/AcrR family transcriptional regulator n=1 Tax=Roseicyclus salinarum TaxID=3036773 RepID=UPI0024157E72|nr:TetR/AcrR family transcriptional regulator [Roseibacterium sp. SDUM158017]MDG4649950.1 helix-turn-helix domain containing protein [Roseibacterium sp. SDUM158017]
MTEAPPSPSLTGRIRARVGDPRAWAVLEAAYASFLQFGLKRTSMQDIADRAGMSRAALYLHYRNKEDIFHALMEAYFAAAADAVGEALAAHGDPARAIAAAFEAQMGDAAEMLLQSPHSDELLSAKTGAARDVVRAGYARLADVYGDWLAGAVVSGQVSADAVGSDPRATASAMLAALDGLKQAGLDWPSYLAARGRLARLFGRAFRA